MSTFQKFFTPIFIIISLCILIAGTVGIRFLDTLFAGSKNLNSIRMFAITLLINVIILLFLIMSFNRVVFNEGPQGPIGNRGERGYKGSNGGINICKNKPLTVEEEKYNSKSKTYLNMQPPLISDD